jgi:hypothetical protein
LAVTRWPAWTESVEVVPPDASWLTGGRPTAERQGWGRRHVVTAAGSALVVRAGLSFLVEPLSDVDGTVKYALNAAMLGGVAALLLMAAHRLRRQEPSAC